MKITEINGNDLTVMQGESGEIIIVNPDIFQDATYSEVEDDVKKRVFDDFKQINPDKNMVIGERTISHGKEFRFEFEESPVPFDHIKVFDIDDFSGDYLGLEDAFRDAMLEAEGYPDSMIVNIFQHEDGSYSIGNCHEENWRDHISFSDKTKTIGNARGWSVENYDIRVEGGGLSDRQRALEVYSVDGSDWYSDFLRTFNLN